MSADPRLSLSDADRKVWYDASRQAAKLWGQTNAANKRLGSLKKQLEELKGKFEKDDKAPEAVKKATGDLLAKVEAQAKVLDRQEPLGFAGAPLEDDPVPLLGEARGLYFSFSAITAAPTPQQAQYLPRVEKKVGEPLAAVNALLETDVPAFNRLLLENGRGLLEAGAPIRRGSRHFVSDHRPWLRGKCARLPRSRTTLTSTRTLAPICSPGTKRHRSCYRTGGQETTRP